MRGLLVSAAMIAAACLGTSPGGGSSSQACGTVRMPSSAEAMTANPSKLDYLVLATMAYSSRPLAMASYSRQASGKPDSASTGGDTPAVLR